MGNDTRLTYSLWPETGQLLGLGRSSTFEAARRGQIPTLRIGRRLLVPRSALSRLLESAGSQESPQNAALPGGGSRKSERERNSLQ